MGKGRCMLQIICIFAGIRRKSMMLRRFVILLLVGCISVAQGWGRGTLRSYDEGDIPLLDSVFAVAREVASRQWHYTGEYYYRGANELKRKTLGVLTLPNRRYYRKGGRKLLTEYFGDMEYTRPDAFVRKARCTYGLERRYEMNNVTLMEFFNLTIYNDNLLGDHILSPLSRRNAHYYRYCLDSICGDKVYFSYARKSKNMQLVDGSFVFDVAARCVRVMNIRGAYNFVTFDETVTMGAGDGDARLWPERVDFTFKFYCYGSKFEGDILYTQENLVFKKEEDIVEEAERKECDLTERYALALDTQQVVFDSATVASHRTDTLPQRYAEWYKAEDEAKDTTGSEKKKENLWVRTIGNMGDVFFHDHNIISTARHSLKIKSPVFGYSNSKGVTVREDIVFENRFKNGQLLTLRPSVSYFNKREEFSSRVYGEYLLNQRHNEKITSEAGVRTVTTNLESLGGHHPKPEEQATTLRFKDYYFRTDVGRELFNGFDVSVGMLLHHRTPRGYAEENAKTFGLDAYYRDFATQMTVTYTPNMKYYFVGNRKERIGSNWPTFLVNYERGIKGVLGSTNNFERWETLASQDCKLSSIHRIIWMLGYGMFTSKESSAFVQYDYFNEGISAYNWEDDCSGVFQLLDSKYYNNSHHYFRAHAVYESPMLILGRFNTRVLRAERLYGNLLMTEGLIPYIEVGYGVSSVILDVSVFTSYLKSESFTYGFKFNLHL